MSGAAIEHWQWIIRLLGRRVWIRAALFCVFAVVLALAGAILAPFVPYDFGTKIGARSVDNILGVLASSMLAVTTFSLTAMVQAYAGATSTLTPRAVQLLIADTRAQTALSTFLGSFLFAVVGIIALSTGIYGETGRVILYLGTIFVILVIVVTFLRWIQHITHFGRVSDTVMRVERAAIDAVRGLPHRPAFGPRAPIDIPDDATRIMADAIGRVTHVDMTDLSKVAEEVGAIVHLAALPGTFVDPGRAVAWIEGDVGDDARKKVAGAFTLDPDRAFDQDPRFGLVVLGEIASRALSPAVNDPGTAIAVLEAGTRVIAALLEDEARDPDDLPKGVDIPPFAFADLLEDLYRPIARDGAAMIEVGIRLQKSLGAIQAIDGEATENCRYRAADALDRANQAMPSAADREKLLAVHRRFWGE